jgi:hypothetical protein
MDVAHLAETGEAEAYVDMFRAMPRPLAEALGMEVLALCGGVGLVLKRVDQAEFNRVFAVGRDRPLTPEDLDEVAAVYRPLGLSKARVQPGPGAPEAAEGWLAKRGMARAPAGWTKRARPTEVLPQVTSELAIADAADAPGEFGRVACAAFGMPPPMQAWTDALVGRPDWRCFLAMDGERAVSAGALYLGEAYGWLGIGATTPEARGRGGQGLVMRARIEAARDAGKAWAITETGAPAPGEAPGPSYRNMDRYGFDEVYVRPNYVI